MEFASFPGLVIGLIEKHIDAWRSAFREGKCRTAGDGANTGGGGEVTHARPWSHLPSTIKKALQCATPPAQRCLKREHLTPTVQWVPALETGRAREVTVRVSGREIRIQCFCFQSDFYDCSLSRCRRAADGRRRLNYKCALRSPPLFPLRWRCVSPPRSRFLWPGRDSWQKSSTHGRRRLDRFSVNTCSPSRISLIISFSKPMLMRTRRQNSWATNAFCLGFLHISLNVCGQNRLSAAV